MLDRIRVDLFVGVAVTLVCVFVVFPVGLALHAFAGSDRLLSYFPDSWSRWLALTGWNPVFFLAIGVLVALVAAVFRVRRHLWYIQGQEWESWGAPLLAPRASRRMRQLLLFLPSIAWLVAAWQDVLPDAVPVAHLLAGTIVLVSACGLLTLPPRVVGADGVPALPVELEWRRRQASEANDKRVREASAGEGIQTYSWSVERGVGDGPSVELSARLYIDPEALERFRAASHETPTAEDYGRFIREGACDEVFALAACARSQHQKHGFTPFEEVLSALAFARQFRYVDDLDSTGKVEYPRYPLEMLADREGDCEDFSSLAAALLLAWGFDVLLLLVRFDDGGGHAALGVPGADDLDGTFFVSGGRKYFYCEATPTTDPDGNPVAVRISIGQLPKGVAVDDCTPVRLLKGLET